MIENTLEQLNNIRIEFRKRRLKRLRLFYLSLSLLTVSGIVLLPLMNYLDIPKLAWAPSIYVAMFIILILIAYTWRCPSCNSHLGDVFKTKYCSSCGIQFTEDTSDKRSSKIDQV